MTHTDYEETLTSLGIRVTANRILVMKTFAKMNGAFSLLDMAGALPTMDNSSLFRTLTLFAEKGLLHLIDDGSGIQKYCVCHCSDHHHHHGHVHLTCIVCHHTYCLESVEIPEVPIPEGFQVREAEYIIKGICPDCAKRKR